MAAMDSLKNWKKKSRLQKKRVHQIFKNTEFSVRIFRITQPILCRKRKRLSFNFQHDRIIACILKGDTTEGALFEYCRILEKGYDSFLNVFSFTEVFGYILVR